MSCSLYGVAHTRAWIAVCYQHILLGGDIWDQLSYSYIVDSTFTSLSMCAARG